MQWPASLVHRKMRQRLNDVIVLFTDVNVCFVIRLCSYYFFKQILFSFRAQTRFRQSSMRGVASILDEVTPMIISNGFITRVVAALSLVTATSLQAGEITGFSWYSGVASVASTTIYPPVTANNDDVVGLSPNEVFITQKNYVAVGPVDLVFDVTDTGGVTEYDIKEGVFNNTGLNWTGYHIELGFGHDATYVKSLSGDGLDFDAPDHNSPLFFNPAPGFFPSATATEDDIYAGGGVMPYLSFAGHFHFAVDVPDGITSFTIRQSPIVVPEPSTFILASVGLISLAVYRRRSAR